MQFLKILRTLILAGIPCLVTVLSLFLPIDWFALRELSWIISYGAIFFSCFWYIFYFRRFYYLVAKISFGFQKISIILSILLSLTSFTFYGFGVYVWHFAGTHFVKNCGEFSILRYNGSGSTYSGYYSNGIQINSVADDCQTSSKHINRIEICNIKPVFIAKKFIDLPYTNIPQKIYFPPSSNVSNLDSNNLTSLINCLNENGMEIAFSISSFCKNYNLTNTLKSEEKLLDRSFSNNFGNSIVYNSLTQKYRFVDEC